MASIKTSIKQKAKKNATLKLTEQPSLDGHSAIPLIAMKNFFFKCEIAIAKTEGQLYESSSTNSGNRFRVGWK